MSTKTADALRQLVDQALHQALAERDILSRDEVTELVRETVAAELGLAEPGVAAKPSPASKADAPQVSKANRKAPMSAEERRAKRAKYQQTYRAREKEKAKREQDTHAAPAPTAPSTPAPVPTPKAQAKPVQALPPPTVAQVPDVSLDV